MTYEEIKEKVQCIKNNTIREFLKRCILRCKKNTYIYSYFKTRIPKKKKQIKNPNIRRQISRDGALMASEEML